MEDVAPTSSTQLHDLAHAPWPQIETWLSQECPAQYDFLKHSVIAGRLAQLLRTHNRSIGIVGPFGSGKTSIVNWIQASIATASSGDQPRVLISSHSCWGFETSSQAIYSMLEGGLRKVEEQVDAFQVRALPDSYRRTFAVGGAWTEAASAVLLRSPDPDQQFETLCALLRDIKARLVFVIEDLDRNDSASFNAADVLACLQRLRRYEDLSFVLTGGPTSLSRIDFTKLCDHVEYLSPLEPGDVVRVVERVRDACLSQEAFPHEVLSDPHHYRWNLEAFFMAREHEKLSLPQAVASLLNTPRALRHAIGRTYLAWKELYGEIEWDHLLVANVLRTAAPECFSYVLRHWERLHSAPSNTQGQRNKSLDQVRESLNEEWNSMERDAEWDAVAARILVDYLLPATSSWLDAESEFNGEFFQGAQYARYWPRLKNESLAPGEVRDQTVLRDLKEWMSSPVNLSPLVNGICASESYSNAWEDLAGRFLQHDPGLIRLLCEQVIQRLLNEHGSAAYYDTQGFVPIWRFARRYISHLPENRDWLLERIREAARTSLGLTNYIWRYWASGNYAILPREDCEFVRQQELQIMREELTDVASLQRILDPLHPFEVSGLVFDYHEHGSGLVVDVASWNWLAPLLIEALRAGDITVAKGIANLIMRRNSDLRSNSVVVDKDVLDGFFGENSMEVIERLDDLIELQEKNDQPWISELVRSARR